MKKAPIAITMGDPAGIGPEICIKLAQAHRDILLVGDPFYFQSEAKRLQLPVPPPEQMFAASSVPSTITHGKVSAQAGKAAIDSIEAAVQLVQTGKARAIVTAPIHKEAIHAAGSPYPGHTEMLAALAGQAQDSVGMMLENEQLRVILASIHVSLSQAITTLTTHNVLRTIQLAHEALKRTGKTAPRIAVAGLNPHAGEGGLMGKEEITIIAPAIQAAQKLGINASGPYPPDTIFMRARGFEHFDVVVAQYHDQGLIPLKYMGLDQGVNITVGLPFVRTSVDHGTAFDIAGKGSAQHGLANPASLEAALQCAERFSSHAEQNN